MNKANELADLWESGEAMSITSYEALANDMAAELRRLAVERDELAEKLEALTRQEPISWLSRNLGNGTTRQCAKNFVGDCFWTPSFPVYASPIHAPVAVERESIACDALQQIVDLFPINMNAQAFIVNGHRLQVDGDDEFCSSKKARTVFDNIAKIARAALQPAQSADFQRGYLAGKSDSDAEIAEAEEAAQLSPKWRECDAALAAAPQPQGE